MIDLAGRVRYGADAVLTVAWAPSCAACQTPLAAPTRGAVCAPCWRGVALIGARACVACGAPVARTCIIGPTSRCVWCHTHGDPVTRRRAAGLYGGRLRAIIHAFKYDGRRSLARPLAVMMRSAGADILARADVVVPVPLHRTRRWRRGFNQAADLAARLGVPVSNALRRVRPTPPQVGLSSAGRRRSVRDAFALSAGRWSSPWDRSAGVDGRWIVVVDDVMTTGATIEACAAVLRGAGARAVWALTAAQAETRPPTRSPRRRRLLAAGRPHATIPGHSPAGGSCP